MADTVEGPGRAQDCFLLEHPRIFPQITALPLVLLLASSLASFKSSSNSLTQLVGTSGLIGTKMPRQAGGRPVTKGPAMGHPSGLTKLRYRTGRGADKRRTSDDRHDHR